MYFSSHDVCAEVLSVHIEINAFGGSGSVHWYQRGGPVFEPCHCSALFWEKKFPVPLIKGKY